MAEYRVLGRLLVSMMVGSGLLVSCIGPVSGPGTTSPVRQTDPPTVAPKPPSTPTIPPASPTLVPATPTSTPEPRLVFETATRKLREAKSYRFTMEVVHRTSGGDWRYTGEGAFAAPNRFRSKLEGQADVVLLTVFDGQRAYCADTRGPRPDCTTAWGGPVPGASPYAALTYLWTPGEVRLLSGPGDANDLRFGFTPRRTAADGSSTPGPTPVAIQSVTGELAVDRASLRPRQERVTIKVQGPGGQTETVEFLLRFHDYDQPVEIAIPPGTGR